MVRFKTGATYLTSGVNEKAADSAKFSAELLDCLRRHISGDWGDMSDDDKSTNWEALRDDLRIFSAYETTAGKIWIITEADRSATTILFPAEY
jgi:hypothetical protein